MRRQGPHHGLAAEVPSRTSTDRGGRVCWVVPAGWRLAREMPLHVGVAGAETVQMRPPPGKGPHPALKRGAVWETVFIRHRADRDSHKVAGMPKELFQQPRDILIGQKIQGLRTDHPVRRCAAGTGWRGPGRIVVGHPPAGTARHRGTEPKGILQQGATLGGHAEVVYLGLQGAAGPRPGRWARAGRRAAGGGEAARRCAHNAR